MAEQEYQHFLAQTHLKRFLPDENEPGRRIKGKLWVYRTDGASLPTKPVRMLAIYGRKHSKAVEQAMAKIEDDVGPVLKKLDGARRAATAAEIVTLASYMGMTACRNPVFLDGWDSVLVTEKLRHPEWATQFEAEREVDGCASMH